MTEFTVKSAILDRLQTIFSITTINEAALTSFSATTISNLSTHIQQYMTTSNINRPLRIVGPLTQDQIDTNSLVESDPVIVVYTTRIGSKLPNVPIGSGEFSRYLSTLAMSDIYRVITLGNRKFLSNYFHDICDVHGTPKYETLIVTAGPHAGSIWSMDTKFATGPLNSDWFITPPPVAQLTWSDIITVGNAIANGGLPTIIGISDIAIAIEVNISVTERRHILIGGRTTYSPFLYTGADDWLAFFSGEYHNNPISRINDTTIRYQLLGNAQFLKTQIVYHDAITTTGGLVAGVVVDGAPGAVGAGSSSVLNLYRNWLIVSPGIFPPAANINKSIEYKKGIVPPIANINKSIEHKPVANINLHLKRKVKSKKQSICFPLCFKEGLNKWPILNIPLQYPSVNGLPYLSVCDVTTLKIASQLVFDVENGLIKLPRCIDYELGQFILVQWPENPQFTGVYMVTQLGNNTNNCKNDDTKYLAPISIPIPAILKITRKLITQHLCESVVNDSDNNLNNNLNNNINVTECNQIKLTKPEKEKAYYWLEGDVINVVAALPPGETDVILATTVEDAAKLRIDPQSFPVTGALFAPPTIDGMIPQDGDLILVKDSPVLELPPYNIYPLVGIYGYVSGKLVPIDATEFNIIHVLGGNTLMDTNWRLQFGLIAYRTPDQPEQCLLCDYF